MFRTLVFVVFLFVSSVHCLEDVTDWARLYDYTDFGSTTLFHHNIPDLTTECTWTFQVDNKYPDECDNKNVTIVLQHNSLPMIDPLRKVTPKNVYVEKSPASRVVLHIKSNNITVTSTINNPKPGPWYTVAYLPPHDGDMVPEDLFVKCQYRIRNWFTAETMHRVETVNIDKTTTINVPGNQRIIKKFFVPLNVHGYIVKLEECRHENNTGCVVSMRTRGRGLPGPVSSTTTITCDVDSTDCDLEDFHPEVNSWQYIEIQSNSDEDLTAILSFVLRECNIEEEYLPSASCLLSPLLDRFRYNAKFKNKFGIVNGSKVSDISVKFTENLSRIIPFQLKDEQDTGGSLTLSFKMDQSVAVESRNVDVKINICLQRNVIPVNVDILSCENGYQGYLNNSQGQGQNSLKVTVPYPEATVWVLGLLMRCYKQPIDNTSEPEFLPCGKLSMDVNISITTDACVEGECSGHGQCINFLNGQVLYTTCRCTSGWQGYDCSDGSEVRGHAEQLLELLLLTLSNIFFLPAIILSLYRRHYVETLVYTFTMVFSALYHACDGGRMEGYTYCALPVMSLSIIDLVAMATTIWITFVSMSRPPILWKGFLQVMGPLGIMVGVLYRQTSAFQLIIPACVGLLLVMISWMCRCCYRHKCYPSKKKYLICLFPGIILFLGGLAIYLFLQKKESFIYTHSAWHACISLGIIFLLPPRETRGVYKVKDKNGSTVTSTYQPIATNRTSTNYVM
ncbi:Transmembrane protein 8A [Mactra antiquata]